MAPLQLQPWTAHQDIPDTKEYGPSFPNGTDAGGYPGPRVRSGVHDPAGDRPSPRNMEFQAGRCVRLQM